MSTLTLRTPKAALLVVFAGLFALAATAIGWSVAVPHMLAAVLGATIAELAVNALDRRRPGQRPRSFRA